MDIEGMPCMHETTYCKILKHINLKNNQDRTILRQGLT